MIRRLVFSLALKSLLLSIVIAALASLFITPIQLVQGEQSMSETLRDATPGITWTGSPKSTDKNLDSPSCQQGHSCDVFTLSIDLSELYREQNPSFAVAIDVEWDEPGDDFDLVISKEGRIIEDSRQAQTDMEEVRLDQPLNGVYQVHVQAVFTPSGSAYRGRVRSIPVSQKTRFRVARYLEDSDGRTGPGLFQFAPDVSIGRPHEPGIRTDIKIDSFGRAYIAQNGSTLALGGLHPGGVYVSEPSQWIAAAGRSNLYLMSPEQTRLAILLSTDGGRTLEREVIVAQRSVAVERGEGNLITDFNGVLFSVYTGASRNELYVVRCDAPCRRSVTRRIFIGDHDVTVDHPYPVIASDRAGGLHIVFSDGRRVLLMSSADGGATWKDPVPVNDPSNPQTSQSSSPWVLAGDSGRVGVVWRVAGGASYYAFTSDAFSPFPTFSYVLLGNESEGSLPSAAVDPFGNANIVYGSTMLASQIAGARLFFDPLLNAVGSLKTENGAIHVSFSVKQDSSGSLSYLDEQRGLWLKSARFTSSPTDDKRMRLSGSAQLPDGASVTFIAMTGDPRSGNKDFSISVSNGYFAEGVLESLAPIKVQTVSRERRPLAPRTITFDLHQTP